MTTKLTDEQQNTINVAKEDIISVYADICEKYGYNSRIAKRLDKILSNLEILQNDY